MRQLFINSLYSILFLFGLFFVSITPRQEFELLLIGVFFSFSVWTILLKKPVRHLLLAILAIGGRLLFYWELPLLSDDFYRFIWDGRLLLDGVNPIGKIPLKTDVLVPNAALLLDNMNSPNYPSVYPPIHQLGMTFGAMFNGLSAQVNGMRVFIFLFETSGFIYFLRRSANELKWYLFYLVNPLIIIEGTGNVHFEAALLPLVAIGVHQIKSSQVWLAGLSMAGAVLIKLNPLMLIPAFWTQVKSMRFIIFNALVIFIGFLPFLSGVIDSLNGIDLFFRSFEFNASIYYLVVELGEWLIGYNPISTVGPVLALISLTLILLISFGKDDLQDKILFVYLVFLLFSSTVHPWYIIPVVFFALSAQRLSISLWSFTVFFSYTHYLDVLEPKYPWLIAEYLSLLIVIIYEWRKKPLQLFRG